MIDIGYADAEDAGTILRIVRQTMPGPILACTPLGCAGAQRYVTDLIENRRSGADRVWLVAKDTEKRTIGFMEIRLATDSLFLNHIHVDPEYQGRGIGSHLFRESLELLRLPTLKRLDLDVFLPENERAYNWYSCLGFRPMHRSAWMTIPIPESTSLSQFYIRGMPQSLCLQGHYGFSMFTIQTEQDCYEVGCLGDRLVRSSEPHILGDPGAMAALHQIAPQGRLLLIAPEAYFSPDPTPLHPLATSTRMTADFDVVRASLKTY